LTSDTVSFDRAANYYDQTRELPEAIRERGLPALLEHVTPNGRILDVGTGTGRISIPLMQLGADLIGCDISTRMMDKLRTKYPAARLAQADALRLPFASHQFEAVLTVHVLHLIGGWRTALREIKRVLKRGGVHLNTWYYRPGTSLDTQIRDYWRGRVEAHGGQWRRPGAQDYIEVWTELQSLGATIEEVEAAILFDSATPRDEIDHIAQRVFSDAWSVADDIYDVTVNELREWAAREYGDLDQPHIEEAHFMLHIAHFD
jgi:ubiquinone/menaquinone biosynthesis C-methylase UbiE